MGPQTESRANIIEMRGWEAWSVSIYQPNRVVWSARPIGALSAVITDAENLDDLERAINRYESHLDSHVHEARQKLDRLPISWVEARLVQEKLISALAVLAHAKAEE